MKVIKKIGWFLTYALINIIIYLVERNIVFGGKLPFGEAHSGFEVLDTFLNVGGFFLNVLSGLAEFVFLLKGIIVGTLGLLLFIPINIKLIKPRFQNENKRMLLGLLAAVGIVLVFHLGFYLWEYIERYYF